MDEELNTGSQLQLVPVGDLVPNTYNPNRMSDEEFNEYVAEVEHRGRLSKPVVVRQGKDSKKEIIDGEHGWRAAKQLGFEQVLCKVLGDDDACLRWLLAMDGDVSQEADLEEES
jgi:ParB family chromosome partitioning protein